MLAARHPVRFALVYVKAISRNKLVIAHVLQKSSFHWAAAVLWWDASSELAKWSTGSSAESAWNFFLISQLLQHPVDGAVRWGTYACNTSFQQAHLVSLTLIFHCIFPVTGVSYRLKQSPELLEMFSSLNIPFVPDSVTGCVKSTSWRTVSLWKYCYGSNHFWLPLWPSVLYHHKMSETAAIFQIRAWPLGFLFSYKQPELNAAKSRAKVLWLSQGVNAFLLDFYPSSSFIKNSEFSTLSFGLCIYHQLFR